MHRKGIGAVVAAGAVAAAITALPASGQSSPEQRTLEFTTTEHPRDNKFIDVGPRGMSVGDRFTVSSTLRSGGQPVGRLEADCVALDRTYSGLACSGIAILADGRLVVQGVGLNKRVPGVGRAREQYVITGGSGAYEGVTGVMTRRGDGDRDTLALSLRFR